MVPSVSQSFISIYVACFAKAQRTQGGRDMVPSTKQVPEAQEDRLI
jgi:hypothetical protein